MRVSADCELEQPKISLTQRMAAMRAAPAVHRRTALCRLSRSQQSPVSENDGQLLSVRHASSAVLEAQRKITEFKSKVATDCRNRSTTDLSASANCASKTHSESFVLRKAQLTGFERCSATLSVFMDCSKRSNNDWRPQSDARADLIVREMMRPNGFEIDRAARPSDLLLSFGQFLPTEQIIRKSTAYLGMEKSAPINARQFGQNGELSSTVTQTA